VLETVATLVVVLAHVTVRPVKVFPLASLRVADACVLCPATRVALESETTTDATGTSVTVATVELDWPPLVAVIVAEPATRPLTRPADETVATVVLLDDHVIARPVRTLPPASRVTAESCTVAPT
jgi:hypothetical protein